MRWLHSGGFRPDIFSAGVRATKPDFLSTKSISVLKFSRQDGSSSSWCAFRFCWKRRNLRSVWARIFVRRWLLSLVSAFCQALRSVFATWGLPLRQYRLLWGWEGSQPRGDRSYFTDCLEIKRGFVLSAMMRYKKKRGRGHWGVAA